MIICFSQLDCLFQSQVTQINILNLKPFLIKKLSLRQIISDV